MTTSMWFNSDIWFEMESIGQVTTYPHKTEVFVYPRDVITITFNGTESATVKRQRNDSVVVYTLGYLAVKYNVDKLIAYAKEHNIYYNVTDQREWESPVVVEDGETKDYKGVAKAYVVRGYENFAPYRRLTALVLPDGRVRLMRYGDHTYKVADQPIYTAWDDFAVAVQYVDKLPSGLLAPAPAAEVEYTHSPGGMDGGAFGRVRARPKVPSLDLSSISSAADDVQEVDVPEEESVEVGEETDEDSSSDYEPEKEREFYRSQARDRKRRRVEKTMRVLMAVGGDDENVGTLITPVDFHFHNMVRATKTGKLYRLDFANGAYMVCGKGSITYAKANGESMWMAWEKPSDFNDIAVWIWDQPAFERPA